MNRVTAALSCGSAACSCCSWRPTRSAATPRIRRPGRGGDGRHDRRHEDDPLASHALPPSGSGATVKLGALRVRDGYARAHGRRDVELHQELGAGEDRRLHVGAGRRLRDQARRVLLVVLELGRAHLLVVLEVLEQDDGLHDVLHRAAHLFEHGAHLVEAGEDLGLHADRQARPVLGALRRHAAEERDVAHHDARRVLGRARMHVGIRLLHSTDLERVVLHFIAHDDPFGDAGWSGQMLLDDRDDAAAGVVDLVLRRRLGHHAHERLGAGGAHEHAAGAVQAAGLLRPPPPTPRPRRRARRGRAPAR